MKIFVDVNLNNNELKNTKVENVSSLPTAGNKGRIVLNTTDNELYFDNGTMFKKIGGGSGGLQYFSEVRNTNAPNDTVPAHQLITTGNEQNIDIVLSCKGYGALIRHIPDGTSTGGHKRGVGAVDLQIARSNPDEVASGDYSVLGGGVSNKVSGERGFVGGGSYNVVSKEGGVASGGYDNDVSAPYGIIIGGRNALTTNYGGENKASGCFSQKGDAQRGCYTLFVEVDTMAEKYLYLDGNGTEIEIPIWGDYGAVWGCELSVVAIGYDSNSGTVGYFYWKPSSISFMAYWESNRVNVLPTMYNKLPDVARGNFYNNDIKLTVEGDPRYLKIKITNDNLKYRLRVFARLDTAELSY